MYLIEYEEKGGGISHQGEKFFLSVGFWSLLKILLNSVLLALKGGREWSSGFAVTHFVVH